MDKPRRKEHVRGVGKKEQRQYEHIKSIDPKTGVTIFR